MTSTESIRTAVIVGSTRPSRLGPAVAEWVAEARVERLALELVDPADLGLNLLDEPEAAMTGNYRHAATRQFSALISGFDAFVLVTPEYNHSTSAALKNVLDHLYAEWSDKPVAFVGYGIDGGVRAVEHLRTICAELGMAGVGPQVALDLREDFGAEGTCAPRPRQLHARERMLGVLVRWALAFRPLRSDPKPTEEARDDRGRTAVDHPELGASAGAALERFVAGIQAGLDHGDAERYDADFAADVIWGTPFGETLAGFESLSAAHRSLMARGVAADSRYEVVQMRAPATGVAVAHVRRRALGEGFSEMALYVLVERGGRWWLAAGQNTPIRGT